MDRKYAHGNKYSTSLGKCKSKPQWDNTTSKIKKILTISGVDEKQNSYTLLVGMQNDKSHSGKVGQFLVKLNIHLPCDTTIPLLHIYPREMKIYIHIKICTQIFTAVLFKITRNCKQCKYPSTGEWMWYIHIMDYYSEIKRNELLTHIIYMTLKGIMLEKSQSP